MLYRKITCLLSDRETHMLIQPIKKWQKTQSTSLDKGLE